MLKHNKLKPVGIAIRLMWNMDKWLLIHSIITSVIEAAIPFAGILLSAYILDGLQAGEEFTEIISVSLAAVAVIFLLTVLKAYFSKILNVHIGMCGKRYDTLMSMKTISMDYPLLDSPAVNDIRVRIRHDNDWGAGFYSLVWQLPYLLNSLISTFVSVVLMLPLFMEGHFSQIPRQYCCFFRWAPSSPSTSGLPLLKTKSCTVCWTILLWIKAILAIFYGMIRITIMERISASMMQNH